MILRHSFKGALELGHLISLKDYCESGLKEGNSLKKTFKTEKQLENEFVFDQIMEIFLFLKQEVGCAMIKRMFNDTLINTNFQPKIQYIDESATNDKIQMKSKMMNDDFVIHEEIQTITEQIADSTIHEEIQKKTLILQEEFKTAFEQNMKILNGKVSTMQEQVKQHTKSIRDLCQENQELKEEISLLEKVYQDQIENFQDHIQKDRQKSNQIIEQFKEKVRSIIKNEQATKGDTPVESRQSVETTHFDIEENFENVQSNFNDIQEIIEALETQQEASQQVEQNIQKIEDLSQQSYHQSSLTDEEPQTTNANEESSENSSTQEEPEEEKHSDSQISTLNQKLKAYKEHALDKVSFPYIVCKYPNGAIFTAGDNQKINKMHNNQTQTIVDTDESIDSCVIGSNYLYCGLETKIMIIDCDTLKCKKPIELKKGKQEKPEEQENYTYVTKMIYFPLNNQQYLLCIQNDYGKEPQCNIYIISLDTNWYKMTSVDFSVYDVIQTEIKDEFVFATQQGLIFYKLDNQQALVQMWDKHLTDEWTLNVVQLSKDTFMLYIKDSYKLTIYNKTSKTILQVIDIPSQTNVNSLQSLQLKNGWKSKMVLMKDLKSLNAINTENYSFSPIADLDYDDGYYLGPRHNSLFQEIQKDGVNILTLGHKMVTNEEMESKIVEFVLDNQFVQ